MASLNSSTNGPSIRSSYQGVISSSLSAAFNSPTYGQWALFSVSTPLVNAFRPDQGGKESILKVQSTGEGELVEMIEEFSEGRIQFAFLKIKDSNTSLPKYVLVGWCGEGVPERTKGYFTSHLAAVSSIFHGYHVQITARSDRDLTPEIIIKKVADASGAKYSQRNDVTSTLNPPVTSKPVFSPSQFSTSSRSNILANSRSRGRTDVNVDDDGWGADAPQVTRSQLEKVAPAYKPTKVNMAELTKQKSASSQNDVARSNENSDIVKGGYQPVGKVDIAAIRAQSHTKTDDRPTIVKGAYEPVGKVDIAAIRAKAHKPSNEPNSFTASSFKSNSSGQQAYPVTIADKSTPFSQTERLTALPKPKVTNKFGTVTANFTGTKAPKPGGIGSVFTPAPFNPPTVGTASKTFADEGGKTPSQVWQEKKARERGLSGVNSVNIIQDSQNVIRTSPVEELKSGSNGKRWAPVITNPSRPTDPEDTEFQRTSDQEQGQEKEIPIPPLGGISAVRQQFQDGMPVNPQITQNSLAGDLSPPPAVNISTRPMHNIPPPLPPSVNSPDNDTSQRESSPIRVAIPVARSKYHDSEAAEETQPPNTAEENLYKKSPDQASVNSDTANIESARIEDINEIVDNPDLSNSGKCALIQYDYEIAEDNEIQLVEGEYVTNIDMVDDDWWMGTNSKGESGLFPSNYVELVNDVPTPPSAPPAVRASQTATALYDYEAAEDNELSFEEDAVITNVEFPDDDWWHGTCNGKSGLFPANYVQLNE